MSAGEHNHILGSGGDAQEFTLYLSCSVGTVSTKCPICREVVRTNERHRCGTAKKRLRLIQGGKHG